MLLYRCMGVHWINSWSGAWSRTSCSPGQGKCGQHVHSHGWLVQIPPLQEKGRQKGVAPQLRSSCYKRLETICSVQLTVCSLILFRIVRLTVKHVISVWRLMQRRFMCWFKKIWGISKLKRTPSTGETILTTLMMLFLMGYLSVSNVLCSI